MTDTKLDFLRLDDAIIEVNQEILVLEDEEKTIQRQLENMKKMNCNVFWLNPIIHPNVHVNYNSPTFLVIEPRFCLQRFHYNDIIMTSYKHMYHPLYFRGACEG